jgi:hypothetical protein
MGWPDRSPDLRLYPRASAPSHPDRQWPYADLRSRLQLRGSGGFSPRFPFIQPARLVCFLRRQRIVAKGLCPQEILIAGSVAPGKPSMGPNNLFLGLPQNHALLKLNPLLSHNTLPKGMFDLSHFCD